MHMNIGKAVQRIDAVEKAAGTVRYLGDFSMGAFNAKFVTSTHAHAKIIIDMEGSRCPCDPDR